MPAAPDRERSPASASLTCDDRLLAEAVRVLERDGDEPWPVEVVETGGDDESRIVQRARQLDVAESLRRGLDRTRRWMGLGLAAGMLVMLLVGAGAARVALVPGGEGAVVAYNALGVLLGAQTLLLLAWLILSFAPVRPTRASEFAALIVGLVRALTRRVRTGPTSAAAMARVRLLGQGDMGRWALGMWTHLWWLAFNVGALVTLFALLSVHQYAFTWETTILSERAYIHLTQVLSRGPAAVGLPTPDAAHVRAAGEADPAAMSEAARRAWAWLLMGSLIVYGLLPRAVLAPLCALLARRARGRFRLDLDEPYYATLAHRLRPAVRTQIVDHDQQPEAREATASTGAAPAPRPAGPPAILALEAPMPAEHWPPAEGRVKWQDLGFVDDRETRRHVLETLRHGANEPSATVIVCALTRTPDRGVRKFLMDVRSGVSRRVVLLLTAGHAMRQRSAEPEQALHDRLGDWRAIARQAGLAGDEVIELDLSHLTDEGEGRIAELVECDGEAGDGGVPLDRVDRAFALIVEHCQRWDGAADEASQRALHTAIARLFQSRSRQWFAGVVTQPEALDWRRVGGEQAQRVARLLPASLRHHSRWAVAGAVAGAMGCVASAALIAPAALVTLPTWAMLGAAAGAVAPLGGSRETPAPDIESEGLDLRQTIDGAAVHTLVLALQGLGETRITRVLEAALEDGDDPPVRDCAAAHEMLARLRHRLGEALAREGLA